jgi:FAD/FMN-containing dehydrogenase
MDDIKQVIRGEVDASSAARRTYSHDASIFEVTPMAVLYPRDTRDLSKIVHYVTERRLEGVDVSITARNGGTCMSGGSLTESYVVDMSRHFNHIGAVDVHGRDVWVQGGVMHIDIEKATHPHKLLFAPYTSSRDICGIGGMLGNNASGEKSVKYGPTSKNVERIKVMLSDGNVYEFGPLTPRQLEQKKRQPDFEGKLYREMTKLIDDNWHLIDHSHPRTIKNAAGYALWELWDAQRKHFNLGRLFIGSQGTLGIITEAELKLVPMAKASRMLVVPIESLDDLTPVVRTSMRFNPVTCETFDYNTYNLAKKYHPEDAERAKIADGQHMVVLVVYEGDSQAQADRIAQQAQKSLAALGREVLWIDDQAVAESFLVIRRASFKMLLEHPHKNMRALAFLEDTIVPLEYYGEFLAALESILAEYKMIYTYAGHIGDGSIRLIPLVNMNIADAPDVVMELETRVNDLVIAFGGSISVDHNDGLIRSPYLEQFFGPEMYTLFAKVKELFDPLNIFNPGKKVGASFEYSKAHIVRGNKS